MKRFKKIFTSALMLMTVVVMSGVSFTPTANAAVAKAGDLIKKDGLSAVYYLGEDGRRYVFPNEATFKSWYPDFSRVVTVSATELASYPLGANVVVRPGTNLVKITTDPKVYVVEPNGVLRWVQTEADAIALFGPNWYKKETGRVIDVPDSFFTNYTIGQPLNSGEVPVGSLVKQAGQNQIYYYDGTNYRLIEDEVAFLANRFQHAHVITVNSVTPGGAVITGAEAAIIRTSQGGQATGWQPGQGTGVTVSLNSQTPASQSVPSTVSRVPFTRVNFTASADGATILESIVVRRTGLTTNSASFERIWAERDGRMITSRRALNTNDEAVLTFAPVLNIPAGQTVSIDILASLANAGGNGALGIAAASAVTASGATVSGSFPITGNLMSFTGYDVTRLEVKPMENQDNTVKVGDEDVELARFDIDFTSTTTRDVVVNSITLRNAGAEDLSTAVMDLYLENKGEIVSEKGVISGRNVTFTMKNNGLTMLRDDGDQTFSVKGDVIGKDNATSPSLRFSLNKKEDLYAYEKVTGFGVSLGHIDNLPISTVTIEAGVITISKKAGSPADSNVVAGSRNVALLVANLKTDEAINADGLKIGIKDLSASTATTSFRNVRVHLNNVLLGSFDVKATASTTFVTEEIDSTLSLRKGDNEIRVSVDVETSATPRDNIQVELLGGNLLVTPEYVSNQNDVATSSITGSARGATITVDGGDLTVVRNDGFALNRVIVKGATDVVLGRFAVRATNDNVRLNSISLGQNIAATSTGVATITANAIRDMRIVVDGNQIGTTRNFSVSGATFSSLNFNIPRNTTRMIELRGSFDSSATGTFRTVATFNAQDSLGKAIASQNATTTQFNVTDGGELRVTRGANTPSSAILVARAGLEQNIAEFRLTAVEDSANITELKIQNVVTTSTTTATSSDPRISSYRLYLGTTLLDEATPVNGEATFFISGNRLVVPANGSATISVRAVFNQITTSNETGARLALRIVEGSIIARASSGAELSQSMIQGETGTTTISNEMFIRKTRPTFARISGIVGGASASQELGRFSITADANEDLNLTRISFTPNGTGVASVTTFRLYEAGNTRALVEVTGTTTFAGFETIVEKGTSKTYRIVANTSGISKDHTFGVSLSNDVLVNQIIWGEYFVDGFATTTSQYLTDLPLDFGTHRY